MKSVSLEANDDLSDFQSAEASIRLSRTGVALALGALLMPTGAGLDVSLYPQHFATLLSVRLLTTLILLAGLWAIYRLPRLPIKSVSLGLLLAPSLAISTMIWLTNGGDSLYFFGLILLMVFVQLLGFSAGEALVYCGITTLLYWLAVWFHNGVILVSYQYTPLAVFFLVTTSLVCVVICHLNQRNRFTDFRLRKSLDQKNHQLEYLDVQRMEFLANVSHELRTPLAMVLAPLDELLSSRGSLSDSAGASLAVVRRNADRLRILVDDLLDIVRLDHATFRLQLEDVDAREFIYEILATAGPFAQQGGLSMEVECEPSPMHLRLDLARMERVLLNVISNAIKFSPLGGTITIALNRVDDTAVISVSDQGPGIPDDQRERIFERMFQTSTGVATAKGLGLGLSISREIVQWHGGTIDVQPAEPRGSCFRVCMPVVTEEEPGSESSPLVDGEAQTSDSASSSTTKGQFAFPVSMITVDDTADDTAERQLTRSANDSTELAEATTAALEPAEAPEVLIIDDEQDLRLFLRNSLSKHFSTVASASGEEGLAAARRLVPCCILLDFMLPDEDGLSVLRQLRDEPALGDTKIIMLTAHFDENVKLEALRLGANDFLSKPFGLTEVRARVAGLVRSSRMQAELRSEREELRRSLEQLTKTKAQLFQSEKMRAVASLAAGLLHEINNPIHFTLMAVKILRRDLAKGRDVEETLDDIGDGIQRVSDIITDLRTFAYPEEAMLTAAFPLSEAVRTAFRFAASDAEQIQLKADLRQLESVSVEGSKSQVTQVLLNLILNAISALKQAASAAETTAANRPTVQVEAAITRLEAASTADSGPSGVPRSRVFVSVQDNGPGIPEALQAQIWNPFFTTSEPGKGLGLGLSICDTIVRGHGGSLTIQSNANGTRISFDLPHAHKGPVHERAGEPKTDSLCGR